MKTFSVLWEQDENFLNSLSRWNAYSRLDFSTSKCFCLFINEEGEQHKRNGKHGITLSDLREQVFWLLSADEVVLLLHTVVWLQNPLNIIATASDKMPQTVNLQKTKIIVFDKGGHAAAYKTKQQTNKRHRFWNGNQTKTRNSSADLGCTLTTTLKFCSGWGQAIVKTNKEKSADVLRGLWFVCWLVA